MKILVTGATGFIGRHLLRELAKTPHEIVGSGLGRPSGSFEAEYGKLTHISCDISEERANYREFFGNPDAIIHLAWGGLPNYRQLFHFERNLPVHYRFLKNLIQNGVRDVTVVGTCLEYGMRNGPLSEDMDPRPALPYSIAKDSLRRFLEELRNEIKFEFRWIRIFYAYGQGQNENSLLGQLGRAISRGDLDFNMSRGDQIRDFLPVETVAQQIVAISLQKEIQGIVNCCSGKPISVRTFVERYIESVGANVVLNLGAYPYPEYEPFAFWGNPSKLQRVLKS